MPEIPLTTVEQMLIELSDILTYKANLLTIVDEIRTEALVSEEVLTGKYATIIGLTLPNIKTYEAHNSSDQRTMHGGYRDTQLFTGIVRIDVLTSNGEKDTYCRHVSTYIQQYIIDHHEVFKNNWRLFLESDTLIIQPADRAGRWKAQIPIEFIMYKR